MKTKRRMGRPLQPLVLADDECSAVLAPVNVASFAMLAVLGR